jgi:DNA-binding MarR family transcriptional regulator
MSDTIALELDVPRLRHLIGRLSRQLRVIDAASGLTPTQSSVLSTVVRSGRMRLSELSAAEGIGATLLSRSIGTLESRGLVRRIVDERDRRAASLEATPAGRRLVRRVRDARSDALRGEIADLSADDQRRLADAMPVLELLVDRLRPVNREAPRGGSAALVPARRSPQR